MSKSMNGLNVVNADEITTDNFSATSLSATNLTVSGAITLPLASINDSALSSNIVKKNTTNAFTPASGVDSIQVVKFGGGGYVFINSSGDVGFWDGAAVAWRIYSSGTANLKATTITGGLTASATQSINFGSNAPIMSGANITGLSTSYCDLTTNQNVGGVKNFTDNLRAHAAAGDVFQAYKNGTGNAGHVLINSSGELLYYDSTALAEPWKLDPTGGLTTSGNFLPKWSSTAANYTHSYKLGLNVGQFMNTLSTNNICLGDYSMNGAYNSNPVLSRASDNVCLGHYTGYKFADVGGGNTNSCNRNVVLGNESLSGAFINSSDNVIIGYRAIKNAPAVDSCVIIGSNAFANNSAGQSKSVIIGALNMQNSNANSGQNTVIGYSNYLKCSGNDSICIGANNAPLAIDNNGGFVLGVSSAQNHTTGSACFYIGKQTGNENGTGSNIICLGNYIHLSAGNLGNSTYIGHDDNSTGTSIQADYEFVIGGAFNYITSKLTLPNKTYVSCVQYVSAATFNLAFRTEDTVVLSATTTTINLPTSSIYDFNSGASFTFIKNYSTTVSITLNAPAGKSILDVNGVSQSTIVLPQYLRTFYLKVVNNSSATNIWAIDYTALSATSITNGTLPDSVLSSNVALENITNTFTATQNFTAISATGDIQTTTGSMYAKNFAADLVLSAGYTLDITTSTGFILFSGATAGIRIGLNSTATIDTTLNNINIGNSSTAVGGENVVIGYLAKGGTAALPAKGQGAVQVGAYCSSEGQYSVGLGHTTTSYTEGIAIGRNAIAQAQGIAIGKSASANTATPNNISIGLSSLCNPAGTGQCIAIGDGCTAGGTTGQSIAIGHLTTANGSGSISIGKSTTVSGLDAVGIGNSATATHAGSVALGPASSTYATSQISLGTTGYSTVFGGVVYAVKNAAIIAANITLTAPLSSSYPLKSPSTTTIIITLPTLSYIYDGVVINFRRVPGGSAGAFYANINVVNQSNGLQVGLLTTAQNGVSLTCMFDGAATPTRSWYMSNLF